jgi:hypothetical protein
MKNDAKWRLTLASLRENEPLKGFEGSSNAKYSPKGTNKTDGTC